MSSHRPTPTLPRISIILPVYNEAALLESALLGLLRELPSVTSSFEIIITENGSTDQTPRIADELAASYPSIRTFHSAAADYGLALRAGLLAARGDVLVNFAADLTPIAFIRNSLPLLETEDIVLASKYLDPSSDRRAWWRQFIGRGYQALIRALFGLSLHDTQCIKLYRAEAVRPLIAACQSGGALFDTELIVRAHRAGLRLREIPLDYDEVRPSRLNIPRLAAQTLIGLIRLRLAALRGSF